MQFDITDCNPSITENILMGTIILAKNYFTITDHHISINMCAQKKNILYNDGSVSTKLDNPNISIAMGAFDSARASDLVGILLL